MMFKKLLPLLGCAMLAVTAFAGDFKEVSPLRYEYTGMITYSDVMELTALVIAARGKEITIVVDSYGGYLSAGYALGNYTREHDEQIHIEVKTALSAAGLWTLGDTEYSYCEDGMLGFHFPYIPGQTEYPDGDGFTTGWFFGKYLMDMTDLETTNLLMRQMAYLRDTFGLSAFVIWTEEEKVAYDLEVNIEGEVVKTFIEIPEWVAYTNSSGPIYRLPGVAPPKKLTLG